MSQPLLNSGSLVRLAITRAHRVLEYVAGDWAAQVGWYIGVVGGWHRGGGAGWRPSGGRADWCILRSGGARCCCGCELASATSTIVAGAASARACGGRGDAAYMEILAHAEAIRQRPQECLCLSDSDRQHACDSDSSPYCTSRSTLTALCQRSPKHCFFSSANSGVRRSILLCRNRLTEV
jgi:hypothetical protein